MIRFLCWLKVVELKIFYFHFDLHKDVNKNLEHEIDCIIKRSGLLAEQRIKNKID